MTTNERLDMMYVRDRSRCRVRAITALGGLGAAVAGGFLTISLATSPANTTTSSPASLSSTKSNVSTVSNTGTSSTAPAASTSTATATSSGGS
jgi:cytoskeletal protein RodZ